ncbi:hypothetical protein [Amycolatopsis jejuensis]|uniref:hypothetical protein n=1 Tax=Amycolatopsis jejuensis TaxID=330084 RepID=UPI0005266A5E|nr:hypothetical protein [Amycolatopsis jejuensis]
MDALEAIAAKLADAEDDVRKSRHVKEIAELEHDRALRKANDLKKERRALVRAAKVADPTLTTRVIGASARLSSTAVSKILDRDENA